MTNSVTSNKLVCESSALIDLPQSSVSANIVKWKHAEATTAQPQSGGQHKPINGAVECSLTTSLTTESLEGTGALYIGSSIQ